MVITVQCGVGAGYPSERMDLHAFDIQYLNGENSAGGGRRLHVQDSTVLSLPSGPWISKHGCVQEKENIYI